MVNTCHAIMKQQEDVQPDTNSSCSSKKRQTLTTACVIGPCPLPHPSLTSLSSLFLSKPTCSCFSQAQQAGSVCPSTQTFTKPSHYLLLWHHLACVFTYVLSVFPTRKPAFRRSGTVSACSLPYPQHPAHGLAHSRHQKISSKVVKIKQSKILPIKPRTTSANSHFAPRL